jgi:hypothetical protein
MENMQSYERYDEVSPTPATALLPQSQPQPANNNPTYAQIVRSNNIVESPEQFDFRIQQVQPENPNGNQPQTITITSVRSSISSGYLDLTENMNRPQQRRNVRPTSPETSF